MQRIVILLFLFVPVVSSVARAQTPTECTYDTCALRLEPRWGSPQLVRGIEGIPVAGVGLFGTRGFSTLVEGSERALEQARIYERNAPPAAWLGLAGGLLVALPLVYEDRLGTGAALSMSFTGAALSLYGTHLQIRSQRAFSRALWWYNRDLAQ